jgi:hypothetical protein
MLIAWSNGPVTANTADAPTRPAAWSARAMRQSFAPEIERAWGMPGARCTRSLMCEMGREHTSIVTIGSPVSPGIPARNGFNGFLRALLGDRLVCHRRWWNCFRQLDAASRRQDHTTSPSARSAHRQARARVHASRPAVVTIAIAPLWDETARVMKVIWGKREGKYFCKWGWTENRPME